MAKKKLKIELNSTEKLEELLQEMYNESCENIEALQVQMNKIMSSVRLNDENMEAKAKYAKAINDFLTNKDKVIGRKLEIAKIMNEVIKYNGNVKNAIENSNDIDVEELMRRIEDSEKEGEEVVVYRQKSKQPNA